MEGQCHCQLTEFDLGGRNGSWMGAITDYVVL